jgi:AGZA family xanthine/uracil permease-like MFS transporter
VITAQAFQATPREHAPAVALGLFPAIGAWGATVALGAFAAGGGATAQSLLERNIFADVNGLLIHGLLVLERGFIFTCMVVAAMAACLIDRKFFAASIWALCGAAVTLLGLSHSYQLERNNVDFLVVSVSPREGVVAFRAYGIAVAYCLMAVVFAVVGWYARRSEGMPNKQAHI